MAEEMDPTIPEKQQAPAPSKRTLKTAKKKIQSGKDVLVEKEQGKNTTKKPPQKNRKPLYIVGGIFVFFILAYMVSQPYIGTIRFGICKVYLEQNINYPTSLEWVQAVEGESSVRIFYNVSDSFGQKSLNDIECRFDVTNPQLPLLKSVNINGVKPYEAENPQLIERFNVGIPAIIAYPPDLVLPWGIPANIKDYNR
jgi:hypothetical protein